MSTLVHSNSQPDILNKPGNIQSASVLSLEDVKVHEAHHKVGDVSAEYHEQEGATKQVAEGLKEGETTTDGPILVVVMGVSGSGKSTLGAALANALGLPFTDADALHPKANIEKMSAGIPLNDEDRNPWLEIVRKSVVESCEKQAEDVDGGKEGQKSLGVVVGCSALKKKYRDVLRGQSPPIPGLPVCKGDKCPPPTTGGVPDRLPPTPGIPSCKKNHDCPPPPLAPFSISSHHTKHDVPKCKSDPCPPGSPGGFTEGLLTYFIYVKGARDELLRRMEARKDHFMKASMLDSQLRDLEDPEGEEGVVVVPLEASTEEQVRIAKEGLRGLGALRNE